MSEEMAPPPGDEDKKGPGGRPPWSPTPEVIKQIEGLAARGLTKEQIAEAIGIGKSTLFAKQNEFQELVDALNRGRVKAIVAITNKLFMLATEKENLGAIIFWLKNVAGWRDRIETSMDPERPARVVHEFTADDAGRVLAILDQARHGATRIVKGRNTKAKPVHPRQANA